MHVQMLKTRAIDSRGVQGGSSSDLGKLAVSVDGASCSEVNFLTFIYVVLICT